MNETENRFRIIDRDKLNELLTDYIEKYPFVSAVYLCDGRDQRANPYVLLLEVPKEPEDKELYMEFQGDLSFPPVQYLETLSTVYINNEAPFKKTERSYGEWMWFEISDISRIEDLRDFVRQKEPDLVYGRRPARNDTYIFPELRFDTLWSFAEQWARKWPVIQKVTLFRYHPFYETGLFQQNPTKYALLFDVMGDQPLLAEFELAADIYRTIYDETVGGILYKEFMPKAFEDVYTLRPPVDYKKEWRLLVNRPGRRAPWHFEGNPSWLLFDRDGAISQVIDQEPTSSIIGKVDSHSHENADNYFILAGDYWKIRFNGTEEISVRALKGMKYIIRLLQDPGREFQILSLMQGIEDTDHTTNEYDKMTDDQLSDVGMAKTGKTSSDDIKKETEKRARTLLAELEKARRNGIPSEIEEAQREYDYFIESLTSMKRDNVDPQFEKERKRIQKLINTAIQAIKRHHPDLGEHLKNTIRTGTSCSYVIQDKAIEWNIK